MRKFWANPKGGVCRDIHVPDGSIHHGYIDICDTAGLFVWHKVKDSAVLLIRFQLSQCATTHMVLRLSTGCFCSGPLKLMSGPVAVTVDLNNPLTFPVLRRSAPSRKFSLN